VRKHWDHVTGAWKKISKQRQRVDINYDPSMVTALQHGTWMDEEGFKKTCIKEKEEKGGIHRDQPLFGTWRQDARRFMLGKHLSDKKNPMEAKETIGHDSGRKYANSQFSDQNRQDAISRVLAFQIARGARGESTDNLAAETHGHINSAGCKGMAMTLSHGCQPLHFEAPV